MLDYSLGVARPQPFKIANAVLGVSVDDPKCDAPLAQGVAQGFQYSVQAGEEFAIRAELEAWEEQVTLEGPDCEKFPVSGQAKHGVFR